MSNSFFNFGEAIDFGEELKKGYDSVNKSYDRREDLEQENDATRLLNAGMPLKIFNELAELAPSLKKGFDGIQQRAYDKNVSAGWGDITKKQTDLKNEALKNVFKIGSKYKYVEKKALDNGDTTTLSMLKFDGVTQTRARDNFMNDSVNNLTSNFGKWVAQNHPMGFDSTAKATDAFNFWKDRYVENMSSIGFDGGYIKTKSEEKLESLKATFIQSVDQNVLGKFQAGVDMNFNIEISNALNSDKPFEQINEMLEHNLGMFDGNRADGYKFIINKSIALAQKGLIKWSSIDGMIFEDVEAKGDIKKTLLEKLGGSEKGKLLVNGWLQTIQDSKKKQLENIDQGRINYAKEFNHKLLEIEKEDGEFSKLDLANYLVENWDIGKGGQLPDGVKNRLTKEAAADFSYLPLLEARYKAGWPISEADIKKIENLNMRSQWNNRLGFDGAGGKSKTNWQSVSTANLTKAKNLIKTYADTRTKESGKKDKSTRWEVINQNGEAAYMAYFAEEIKTAPSSAKAHLNALERIEKDIIAGKFDQLPEGEGEFTVKQREFSLIKAESIIKASANPTNLINNEIIYGSEKIIEEAASLEDGETHLFYEQLANTLNQGKTTISGAEIQFAQLSLRAKMMDKDEPIKSPMLEALEELKKTNFVAYDLLANHRNQASIIKAKIEAFSPESEGGSKILYNEVKSLMPNIVWEANKKREGKGLSYEVTEDGIELVTPQINKAAPRKGDWIPVPNEEGGVFQQRWIVFDGKQWEMTYRQPRAGWDHQWRSAITQFSDVDGTLRFPTFDNRQNITSWN